jgi:hypothetical protein
MNGPTAALPYARETANFVFARIGTGAARARGTHPIEEMVTPDILVRKRGAGVEKCGEEEHVGRKLMRTT